MLMKIKIHGYTKFAARVNIFIYEKTDVVLTALSINNQYQLILTA